jgi:hypothetical protein
VQIARRGFRSVIEKNKKRSTERDAEDAEDDRTGDEKGQQHIARQRCSLIAP